MGLWLFLEGPRLIIISESMVVSQLFRKNDMNLFKKIYDKWLTLILVNHVKPLLGLKYFFRSLMEVSDGKKKA
jgi:hypothetical protein